MRYRMPPMRSPRPAASIAFCALLFLFPVSARSAPKIILVILDDASTGEFGAYQSEWFTYPSATPNFDSIASEGIRFTNVMGAASCSPFRASVLTGRYPRHHGVGMAISNREGRSARHRGLDASMPNIARILSDRGWRTRLIGKLHVGGREDAPRELFARRMGWTGWDGSIGNLTVSAQGLPIGKHYTSWERCDIEGRCQVETGYSTTVITDAAIAALQAEDSRPLLMVVSYHAPHRPLHKPPEGLAPVWGPRCADPKENQVECQHAMIEAWDTEFARLAASVDFADTTLIIISDNGSSPQATSGRYDPKKMKNTLYTGGVDVPMLIKGRGVEVAGGAICSAPINATDLFSTMLELAGVDDHAVSDSIPFTPCLRNPSACSQRSVNYGELFAPNGEAPKADGSHQRYERVVRTSQGASEYTLLRKYAVGRTGYTEELYDVGSDYFQQTPLAIPGTGDQAEAYRRMSEFMAELDGA